MKERRSSCRYFSRHLWVAAMNCHSGARNGADMRRPTGQALCLTQTPALLFLTRSDQSVSQATSWFQDSRNPLGSGRNRASRFLACFLRAETLLLSARYMGKLVTRTNVPSRTGALCHRPSGWKTNVRSVLDLSACEVESVVRVSTDPLRWALRAQIRCWEPAISSPGIRPKP